MSATNSESGHKGLWIILRSCLVALFISVLVIDTLPATFSFHQRLQESLEPLLDKTGLWQGRWELFAPNPASLNGAILADVKFADGSLLFWTAPDPKSWSIWQKFRNFRWNEYYDTIRLKDYEEAWPSLSDWIASSFQADDNPVVRVRLYRSWAFLNEESFQNEEAFPYSKRRMIFRKEYSIP
jgi:hypothetical protein